MERETRPPTISLSKLATDDLWLEKNACRLAGQYSFNNDYVKDYYFNCLKFKECCFSDDKAKVSFAYNVLFGDEKISKRIIDQQPFKYNASCLVCKHDGKPACGKRRIL